MIQEWLASHAAAVWPVIFLLGSVAIYLAVVVFVWLRPGSPEGLDDLDHLAALPLAADTGLESDSEGRKA